MVFDTFNNSNFRPWKLTVDPFEGKPRNPGLHDSGLLWKDVPATDGAYSIASSLKLDRNHISTEVKLEPLRVLGRVVKPWLLMIHLRQNSAAVPPNLFGLQSISLSLYDPDGTLIPGFAKLGHFRVTMDQSTIFSLPFVQEKQTSPCKHWSVHLLH